MSSNNAAIAVTALLLVALFVSFYEISPVMAICTIYIRADGSIDPPTAPLATADNITYTLTDNILYTTLSVERDNIVVNGAGHTIQGDGYSDGIYFVGRSNVTINGFEIRTCFNAVLAWNSSHCTIAGNNITNNHAAIWVINMSASIIRNNRMIANSHALEIVVSSENTIAENTMTNNFFIGIDFAYSSDNIVTENNITSNNVTSNNVGINLWSSNKTVVRNNIIENFTDGFYLLNAFNNSICCNEIAASRKCGIYVVGSYYNSIYYNNFLNNPEHVHVGESRPGNFWNYDYPLGGNYWSGYNGVDQRSGSYQNETGSDGIGDTPYKIDSNNQDNYPLMSLWSPPDIAVTSITASKTIIGQGFCQNLGVSFANLGSKIEVFNVIVSANHTQILRQYALLNNNQSADVAVRWNTSDFGKGTYLLSALIEPVPIGYNLLNSEFQNGYVYIGIPGDVDGNRIVDMSDVYCIAGCFGAIRGHAINYVSNSDIDDSGAIDILDLYIAATHFGQTDP